jgi:hypothetical protein
MPGVLTMAASAAVAQVELGFQPVSKPLEAPLQVVVSPLPENVGLGPGQAMGVLMGLVGGAADEADRDVPRPRPLARHDAHSNTSASHRDSQQTVAAARPWQGVHRHYASAGSRPRPRPNGTNLRGYISDLAEFSTIRDCSWSP